MNETTLTITREDVERWRNERRAAEPSTVTFGMWEPIYGPERTRLVATDFGGSIIVPVVTEYTEVQDEPVTGYRRKRMERWYDTDGRLMGRWEWQYAGLDMVPLAQVGHPVGQSAA